MRRQRLYTINTHYKTEEHLKCTEKHVVLTIIETNKYSRIRGDKI